VNMARKEFCHTLSGSSKLLLQQPNHSQRHSSHPSTKLSYVESG